MRAPILGLAAALSLAAIPAAAQYQSPYNQERRAQLPAGSYRNSCTNMQVTGNGNSARLTAVCRSMAGQNRTTTLAFRACVGDISNNNGTLTCNGAPPATVGGPVAGDSGRGRPDYDRPTDGLPGGTWRQTCTERRLERVWVKGQCLAPNGRRVLAEANWERCPSFSYSNVNGKLVCDAFGAGRIGGGGNSAQLPGGEWRQTCQSISVTDNGNVVTASCRDERGRLRPAAVDMRTCRNRVLRNNRGVLQCG